jgi:mono/diheme cytochrome c family protein
MKNPIEPTPASIEKGREMFMIYCTPCHGTSGTGNGTVGEKLILRPFDLTSDAVQSLPDGFIFGYMTLGGAVMPSYANDLSPTERWNVVNFVHHGLKPTATQQAGVQTK